MCWWSGTELATKYPGTAAQWEKRTAGLPGAPGVSGRAERVPAGRLAGATQGLWLEARPGLAARALGFATGLLGGGHLSHLWAFSSTLSATSGGLSVSLETRALAASTGSLGR